MNKRNHTLSSALRKADAIRQTGIFFLCLPVLTLNLVSQTTNYPSPSQEEEEVYNLDVFEVTSDYDDTYRTLESNTATGIATELADIPLSVSVLNDKRLAEAGADTLDRILSKSPGVSTQTLFSNEIVVRGFTTTAYLNGDSFTNTSYAGKELFFVDRIEVVKGPNAVFYGLIQPGGVVNTITKRPLVTNQAVVSATIGNNSYYRASVDVNTVMFGDRLRVRVFGGYQDEDFFIESTYKTNEAVGAAAKWFITPDLSFDITLLYNDADRKYLHSAPRSMKAFLEQDEYNNLREWRSAYGVGPLYDTYAYDIVYPKLGIKGNSQGDGMGFYRSEDFTTSGNLIWNFASYFTNRLHFYTENHEGEEIAAGNEPNLDGTWRASAGHTVQKPEGWGIKDELAFVYETDSFSEKLLVGAERNRIENKKWWQGGPAVTIDVLHGERFTFANSGLTPGMSWMDKATYDKSTVDALYAANQLGLLNDRLHVLTGLRWTKVETDAGNYYESTGETVLTRDTRDADDTTYQFGGVLDLFKGVRAFASYSQTFQPQTNAVSFDGTIAGPSSGSGWEAGLKFTDNSVFTGTISVYKTEISDIAIRDVVAEAERQLQGLDPTGPIFILSGLQRVQGGEFELFYTPTEQFQLTFGYSHIWEATTVSNDASPGEVGVRRFNTPRNSFTVSPRYEFTDGMLKGLYIGANVEYKDEHIAHPSVTVVPIVNPSFMIGDVYAGYRTEIAGYETTFRLNINNITDKEYFNGRYTPGNLREFRFGVELRF